MTRYIFVFLSVAAFLRAADFTTGQAARLIIGQRTFTAQNPGPNSDDERVPFPVLGAASAVAFANDTLIVADSNRVGAGPDNHRVLIYRNVSASFPSPTAEIPPVNGALRCPICVGHANVVLGQPDFAKNDIVTPPTAQTLRLPTAVATDGRILAVSDTDNNRVLIWNSIPTSNAQPANVVLGQPDFTKSVANEGRGPTPTARSLRGPQGVWIQNGNLFVADTQNHRVLIWNSIPSSNFQPANVVLGQPNFEATSQDDLAKAPFDPKANTMLNPVSVTSDGVRLYVSDLGHNRVLIWNSLPAQNQALADVVIGQPDMTTAIANNSFKVDNGNNVQVLCNSTGQDDKGNPTFPVKCSATLNFPRFALSDGKRLFIADGGNDRILVYNQVPSTNGAAADIILGQPASTLNQNSDSAAPLLRSSADSVRTPMGLAWDGANLYVSDPFNRRIMVFTVGDLTLPYTGVRNAASRDVFAVGEVTFSGTVKEADEVTIKIKDKEYKYKIQKDDTFATVINALVALINAGGGDPLVFALPNPTLAAIILTARASGEAGNDVDISSTTSANAQIQAAASSAKLAGGGDAAKIAPGTLVTILGENLSDQTLPAPADADDLPRELGGTQVYMDGIRAPLLYVSPGTINAQLPWDMVDSTSASTYVRTQRKDGSITVTTAIAVPVVPQNPGIFAEEGPDPRPGIVMHSSSFATGTVSVDGTAKAGDTATITIEDRGYTYTVKDGDTLNNIRDALVDLVSQDPKVLAFRSGQFTRVRLRARVPGPEGNGIKFSASAPSGAQVILTPTNTALCCANVAFSRVTEDNPALPGETVIVFATGLGDVTPDEAHNVLSTGAKYTGPELNTPNEFVSSLAGGKTANVLAAGLKPGAVGTYEVHLELNSDIPTNPFTQVTIAQFSFVSNIVTFPVKNPNDNQDPTSP